MLKHVWLGSLKLGQNTKASENENKTVEQQDMHIFEDVIEFHIDVPDFSVFMQK